MAAATATLEVNPYPKGVDNTQRRTIIYGTCTLSAGGTYVTNGIPLNWAQLIDGNSDGGKYFIIPNVGPTQTKPSVAWFYSVGQAAGTAIPGYDYVYDTVNNTLRIASGTAELADLAAITADLIGFCAEYIK